MNLHTVTIEKKFIHIYIKETRATYISIAKKAIETMVTESMGEYNRIQLSLRSGKNVIINVENGCFVEISTWFTT